MDPADTSDVSDVWALSLSDISDTTDSSDSTYIFEPTSILDPKKISAPEVFLKAWKQPPNFLYVRDREYLWHMFLGITLFPVFPSLMLLGTHFRDGRWPTFRDCGEKLDGEAGKVVDEEKDA
ncbi:hypothetical protein GGR57DRAFT_501127 [Xylariaceae sp. FL1272]|nr:hypothetical protein GGR57DRAFT_501127 [Xylariaceae sp. FL1272]